MFWFNVVISLTKHFGTRLSPTTFQRGGQRPHLIRHSAVGVVMTCTPAAPTLGGFLHLTTTITSSKSSHTPTLTATVLLLVRGTSEFTSHVFGNQHFEKTCLLCPKVTPSPRLTAAHHESYLIEHFMALTSTCTRITNLMELK